MSKTSKFKQQIESTVLPISTYQIWRIRIEVLWNHKLEIPDHSIKVIKDNVKNRIAYIEITKISQADREASSRNKQHKNLTAKTNNTKNNINKQLEYKHNTTAQPKSSLTSNNYVVEFE